MSEYTFYKISHKNYPELIYIGSTKNYYFRKHNHKRMCYNEDVAGHNTPLYQFIRNNNIIFEELEWTILSKLIYENRESAYKWERFLIESFDTIENGLNCVLPYTTPEELDTYRKEYRITNKEKIANRKKEYQLANREYLKEYLKDYYQQNKQKHSEKSKERYNQNKTEINEKKKQHYEKNKHIINEKIECPICNELMNRGSLKRHKRRKHK